MAVDDLGLGELALIKIDVEGFEPVVLDGMTATVHRSPDAYLIIEVNPLSLEAAGHTADDLLTHPVLHGHQLYFLRDAADVEAGWWCRSRMCCPSSAHSHPARAGTATSLPSQLIACRSSTSSAARSSTSSPQRSQIRRR